MAVHLHKPFQITRVSNFCCLNGGEYVKVIEFSPEKPIIIINDLKHKLALNDYDCIRTRNRALIIDDIQSSRQQHTYYSLVLSGAILLPKSIFIFKFEEDVLDREVVKLTLGTR